MALWISESRSRPGAEFKDGKFEIPQLLDIMSALGTPENSHLLSVLSNPAAQREA